MRFELDTPTVPTNSTSRVKRFASLHRENVRGLYSSSFHGMIKRALSGWMRVVIKSRLIDVGIKNKLRASFFAVLRLSAFHFSNLFCKFEMTNRRLRDRVGVNFNPWILSDNHQSGLIDPDPSFFIPRRSSDVSPLILSACRGD